MHRFPILIIPIIGLFIVFTGCSSGVMNPVDSVSPGPEYSPAFSGAEFPDLPENMEPDRILMSEQTTLDLINTTDVVKVNNRDRFTIHLADSFVYIENPGSRAYDVRIIIDSDPSQMVDQINQFPDDRFGLDFGIIMENADSPRRYIGNISHVQTIRCHIEYRENPFIQNERILLHSSEFDGEVENGISSKYISSNTCIVGCDYGIETLYPMMVENDLLLIGIIEPPGLYRIGIPDDRTPYEIVTLLNSEPMLHNAEIESCVTPAYFPDDPIYDPAQPSEPRWAFERIEAVNAWDYFSDRDLNQSGDASVSGIVFAILDTGITPHQEFALSPQDISLIYAYGKNFVNPGSLVLDTDGHGTAVTGIMGAMGNNQLGMAGMAWNPIFLPIKVFGQSNEYGQVGPLFNLLQGMMYIRDLATVAPFYKFVVNMSLGGYEENVSFWTREAVRLADNRPNVLLVAAAGNDKNDNSFAGVPFAISADNFYPAALDKVVSVGASSWSTTSGMDREVFEEDGVMWGTNWGSTVDFCAPGSLSIYTTSKDTPTSFNPDFGGTSASCAFVSGLAGLIWSDIPSFTKRQVIDRIYTTCDSMYIPPNKNGLLGGGRINAYKALRGTKPIAVINDVYWTRSGDPLFGETLHFSGDGIFTNQEFVPEDDDKLNFRWYADGDFDHPIAYGREAMYYQLPEGPHTIHLKVWNKGKEWNFWDPDEFSDPVEWAETIDIQDSALPDDCFSWIYIPAGDFTMGCGPSDPNYNNSGTGDEKPQHTHYVYPFYIRKYEITNMEFNAFMEADGYNNPDYWDTEGWQVKLQNGWEHPLNWNSNNDKGGNPIDYPENLANPVNGVSWWEAIAFCRFANHRLPTEAEWEKAARGNLDDRTYPWGYDWIPNNCNCSTDTITPTATAPIGTYSPQGDSPYGLCDSSGNVWEWCWEWYDYSIYTQYEQGDYTLPDSGTSKCCRGGGWYYGGDFVGRCSSRYSTALPSTTRYGYIGFRPIYGTD